MIIVEALWVGILIVVIGSVVSFVVGKIIPNKLPKVCKNWNKNYVMEICLFLSGFLGHLLFEITGINKWYCKNGYACLKKN